MKAKHTNKLKASLKDLLPICGIYKITNIQTGRVYIGQSKDVLARWKEHIADLLKQRHHNKLLTEDFNNYGLISFVAELLQECEPEELLHLEAMYIREYQKLAGVYNFPATSGDSNSPG